MLILFLFLLRNVDCGYIEAVLMSTHNLCFRAKIRKKYPCTPQFHYIKVGCKGVYITRTCYPDGSSADSRPTAQIVDRRLPDDRPTGWFEMFQWTGCFCVSMDMVVFGVSGDLMILGVSMD